MAETLYPTLEEILFLHARLIEAFGGSMGERDMGLLESALARPRSGYYGTLGPTVSLGCVDPDDSANPRVLGDPPGGCRSAGGSTALPLLAILGVAVLLCRKRRRRAPSAR